jgi:hypothetical protein
MPGPVPKVQLTVQIILVVGLSLYDVVSSGDYEPSLLLSSLDKATSISKNFELWIQGVGVLGPTCWNTLHPLFFWSHELGALPLLAGKWQDLKFVPFQA